MYREEVWWNCYDLNTSPARLHRESHNACTFRSSPGPQEPTRSRRIKGLGASHGLHLRAGNVEHAFGRL
jgi:hypothetical protein